MKPIDLIIEVLGHVVQEVYTDTTFPISYRILDHDNLEDMDDADEDDSNATIYRELKALIESGAYEPVKAIVNDPKFFQHMKPNAMLEMMINPSNEAQTEQGREKQIRFAHYIEGLQDAFSIFLTYFIENQPLNIAEPEFAEISKWVTPLYIRLEQNLKELREKVNTPKEFDGELQE